MKKTLLFAALLAASTQAVSAVCTNIQFGASETDATCVITSDYALEQVFFDAATDQNTILGHLGSQTDTRIVEFTSTDLISAANGFAQIIGEAPNGGFDNLSFGMQDPALGMEALSFDLRSDTADVFDLSWTSTAGIGSQIGLTLGNGLTTVTMIADPETLLSVSINTGATFELANFKHLRLDPDSVGGPIIQAVPIPAAVWFFGSGLVGLAGVVRRKQASS